MFLGVKDDLQDPHFDKGSQRLEKDTLGDRAQWDTVFDHATTHGVLVITAKTDTDCQTEEDAVRKIFTQSVSSFTTLSGRVRSGDGEFFGWRDGISQPAIKDLVTTVQPGQRVVDPGVLIIGYKGDPVQDDPTRVQRPSFSKDGSFMVFRKLEQDVLGFDDYINRNWKAVPAKYGKNNSKTLTEQQRKDLFGARMVGRFKTGAPLALTPHKDDSTYTDPDLINKFDYTEGQDVDNPNRPPNCPFAAHIRKTAPRNLDPLVQKKYLDASMIVRAGCPYGPEISKEERDKWKRGDTQSVERGLLFVSYQSSIENGFFRQTTEFAANDFFPITTVVPTVHGQVIFNMTDQNNTKYVVNGFAKKVDTSATAYTPEWWITSRGGEYFFVPSISAIKAWCDSPPSTS